VHRHAQAVLNQLAGDLASRIESLPHAASSTQNLIDSRLRRQTIYRDHRYTPVVAPVLPASAAAPEQTRRSALKGVSPSPEMPMTGR